MWYCITTSIVKCQAALRLQEVQLSARWMAVMAPVVAEPIQRARSKLTGVLYLRDRSRRRYSIVFAFPAVAGRHVGSPASGSLFAPPSYVNTI